MTKYSWITKLKKQERLNFQDLNCLGSSGLVPYLPVAYNLELGREIREKPRKKKIKRERIKGKCKVLPLG